MRPIVTAENPGISFGEVGKQLGAKWAEADDKTKKVRRRALGDVASARACSAARGRHPGPGARHATAQAHRP